MGRIAEITDTDVIEMAKQAADSLWREARAEARLASANLPSKPCRRCGGSGEIQHMTHVEWGKCFGCNGLGRVFVRCTALDEITRRLAIADVERLRVLYRGHVMALSMALGGMTNHPEWALDAEVDGYKASLARLKGEGQEAVRRI